VIESLGLSAIGHGRAISWQADHTDTVVCVGSVSASPCGLAQSKQSPELNETVEVAEKNVDRNEDDVCGIPDEVAPELDSLAEDECPSSQEGHKCNSGIVRPVEGGLVPGYKDEYVVRQSPSRDCRLQH